jgi:hypothetical protein
MERYPSYLLWNGDLIYQRADFGGRTLNCILIIYAFRIDLKVAVVSLGLELISGSISSVKHQPLICQIHESIG